MLQRQSQCRFMVSKKCFCLSQHKLLNNHFTFFPKHPTVFFISTVFKLRGFDFINYIFIRTQTNLARWCPKMKKITCNCMAKTDHSGQKKGKNRNFTIFLFFFYFLWSTFSKMWSLSKHANLNISFLNLSFLNPKLVPRGSVVFGIYNFSLFVGNKTHLNEDSNWRQCNVITAVIRGEFQTHKIIALSFA